jgi:alkylation response protein AidB-like acyl-CoA dehydrogenase
MLDAEQEELRRTVRTVLDRRSDKRRAGYDPQLWQLLAEQVGAHSLAIPEEYGGAGFTLLESHIVLEELGAALTPSPFCSTTSAAQAILAAGNEEAKLRLLPGIAAGESIATLAWAEEPGSWDPGAIRATVSAAGRLTGTKHHVLDGDDADVFVVVAGSARGVELYEVARADAVVAPRVSVDPNRPQATVTFTDAPATLLTAGTAADSDRALTHVLDLACVALSAEQVGGAQRALDLTVAYARQRVQFGRPIGSFQAVKHRLADLFTLVESARSASYAAAAVAASSSSSAGSGHELTIAAARAKAYCSEAYSTVAGEAIQLHGGIGITWEHDIHLYFKRAHATAQLFGSPAEHRRRYARAVGLAA